MWIHKDSDLVDVTLSTTTSKRTDHSIAMVRMSETLDTTSEHPFLTQTQGFVPAGKLKLGMKLLRADGNVGVVTGWKPVHGTMTMYNLEVVHDHTFTVGAEQWIVHNSCGSGPLKRAMMRAGQQFQNGQDAHHLIPCALQDHALIQAYKRRL